MKTVIFSAFTAIFATSAVADNGFYAGLEFQSNDSAQNGTSVTADTTGAYVLLGYRYDLGSDVFARGAVGFGRMNGSTSSGNTTFDSDAVIRVGLGYDINDDFYGVIEASRSEVSTTWNGLDWDDYGNGYALKFGYYLTDEMAIEAGYEARHYPTEDWDSDTISIAVTQGF